MSWSVTISGHDGDGDPSNENLQEVVNAAVDAAKGFDLSPTTTVVNGTIEGVSIGPVSTDLTNGEQVHTEPQNTSPADSVPDYPPAKNDNKAAWIAYAVANGETEDEAESQTKEELVDKYSADA